VKGIPPEKPKGEDLLESPASLHIQAKELVGGELFTAVRASAGAATGTCFDVNGIGSPLQNQVAVMKVELDTPGGGATGGEVSVLERSNLGACSVTVKTNPGETGAQIAGLLASAFQTPGVPGPASCPAVQNPRDMTVDGSSLVERCCLGAESVQQRPGLGVIHRSERTAKRSSPGAPIRREDSLWLLRAA
jgi:hypothetical protein